MLDLLGLFLGRGADQLDLGGDLAAVLLRQESVDAHERQRAVVLFLLVEHGFFLDLAALVHGVHGAEHAAALADGFEFLVHGLFHQVGQLLDDEAPLPGVFVEVEPQFLVNNHLYRHGAAHGLLGRRGDGLVVGVGVQAVAVVEQGVERLQRGADVVELDFLRVQRAARGLDVVLEHLAAGAGAVALAHGAGPDAPGHAADDGVFRVHAVGEEIELDIGPDLTLFEPVLQGFRRRRRYRRAESSASARPIGAEQAVPRQT